MTTRTHPSKWRFLFGPILVALWLAVCMLALELYAGCAAWRVAHHNPYIAAAREHQPLPAPRPLQPASINVSDDPNPVTWPVSMAAVQSTMEQRAKAKPTNGWDEPRVDETQEAADRRRQDFGLLDESDRNFSALIHDEMVLAFHRDGRFEPVYGDWRLRTTFENPDAAMRDRFVAAARDAFDKRALAHLGIDIAFDGVPVPTVFSFVPAPTKDTVYAFWRLTRYLSPEQRPLPNDSAWEIPYLRYKNNLAMGSTSKGQGFGTNNVGFRDAPVVLPKPNGLFRIVCVGGSTTEEGPSNDQTYPNILEAKLRERFPGRALEVVNCGIAGITSSLELLRLGDYLALEPDMVLIYDGVNDITLDMTQWAAWNLAAWRKLARRSLFLRRYESGRLHPPMNVLEHMLASHTLAHWDAMSRVFRERGIPVVFASLACPDRSMLNRDERQFFDFDAHTHWNAPCLSLDLYCNVIGRYNALLKDFCRQRQMRYLPIGEHLHGGAELFIDICHMTDPGIERKASLMFDGLAPYLQPALDALPVH